MRLGIVSDTHGRTSQAVAAATKLAEQRIDVVLHCGDVGGLDIGDDVIRAFAAWPAHFVAGNVDRSLAALERAVVAAGQTFHGRFGELEFGGRHVALLHGDDTRRLDEAIRSQQYDLVCSGHTHVAAGRVVGRTLVLNPGALHRARAYTVAVVDLDDMTATHLVVEKE